MKKNETTKTNVTKKVTGMLMALFMLICSVPVPAAAPNNFVISDEGLSVAGHMKTWSSETGNARLPVYP